MRYDEFSRLSLLVPRVSHSAASRSMGMAGAHGHGEDDGAVPWLARGYGVSRPGMGGWPTRGGVRAKGEQRKMSRGLTMMLCNFFLQNM